MHLTINKQFTHHKYGILFPKTSDGRVLFMLPWEHHCIVGTTDEHASPKFSVKPSEKDINFILNNISHSFNINVQRENILSAWAGIRPLVKDQK